MENFRRSVFRFWATGLIVLATAAIGFSQQVKRPDFDVTDYKMDVQLIPNENKINATTDVSFTPAEKTRSVTFELNGSLKNRRHYARQFDADGDGGGEKAREECDGDEYADGFYNFYSRSGRRFGFGSECAD